ncbi:glycosyltransferase family 39 protein [Actinospica sp. MGRD01-02]|uniref:Glycosyltransferase family 39 protein n=1 Tax=Actinospica acidithermotolerans TaxID=2828514 RepID=A0A941EBZ3_9ACTN|nr:glycosyltransferase family 39 protein [Actinospica acidithermotolerans]MBR7828736.1 glycosyltransferase family 39 protein [Actinospica acidithermotolerans]
MSDEGIETESSAETRLMSPAQPSLRDRFAEWMDEPGDEAGAGTGALDADPDSTQVIPAAVAVIHPQREPIPVPPEFASPPRSATAANGSADVEAETAQPAAGTQPATGEQPAAPDTRPQAPGGAKPAGGKQPGGKPDDGGFHGPPRWQDHVPFDETGVLMRPESLRAKAMHAETELISAIKIEDDDSEAAKSQRPGFWTGAWPRRALVGSIMAVQAVLSLRNNNSPFVDESLYLYSGHLELAHMLHGTSTGIDFWSYFSGAPVLYPPLGALADQIGGIFAARLLSLLFMLATTGLLYLITRRLFGTRAGLCAAALFSCTEPTLFLGGLATYDAPALFLLALATFLVVRFAASNYPFYLLAVFPAALAVGTKYVSLLFVPTIFVLAFLAAAPYSRAWAVIRPIALSLGTACVLYTGYRLAGTSAAAGISATTTNRAHGTDTLTLVMKQAGQYIGVVFVIALIGAVFVVRLPRRHAHPAVSPDRWQRTALAVLLAGTALLAPLYQAHLHTAVSLQKHVGFGLFFAAPLAGYGLVRIVGPHFHRVQLGIGVLVLTFALGMGQSLSMFHSWTNSYAAVAALVKYQKPGAHYLFADGPNAIYLLRGDPYAEPSQITDAFSFGWWDEQGKYITGDAAYADAIQAGYFQVVSYDFSANPGAEQAIAQALYNSPIYRLAAKIYTPTSGGPAWSYVWVRK